MSNPTDTNQASEDELTYSVDPGIPGGEFTSLSIEKGSWLFTFTGAEAVAIIDVIRTEKLKLLAEVREQVVGEDEDRNHRYNESWKVEVDAQNYLRKEQRAALDKLEAEL